MPFTIPTSQGARAEGDTRRYRYRFSVPSDSNPRNRYNIAFDVAKNAGYWTCSCKGCCTHGHCKHLKRFGLKGRKYGADKKMILEALGLTDPSWSPLSADTILAAAQQMSAGEEDVPIWTDADVAVAMEGFQ